MTLRFLVVASETPAQRDARRAEVGAASDETYAETLRSLRNDIDIQHLSCVDGSPIPTHGEFRRFDAAFFAGSPLQMDEDAAEGRAAASFMLQLLEAGLPAFGSCAGLQIAAVAAGGRMGKRGPRREAAFARGIVATDEGASHPMLAGRPVSWDAPAMHSGEITALPDGAVVLARTRTTPVQAAEIRKGEGVFWGVQYHPELALSEIAASLRREAEELVEEGLAKDREDVGAFADRIDELDREPQRADLAWQLGLDVEVLDPMRRMTEIRNFIAGIEKR